MSISHDHDPRRGGAIVVDNSSSAIRFEASSYDEQEAVDDSKGSAQDIISDPEVFRRLSTLRPKRDTALKRFKGKVTHEESNEDMVSNGGSDGGYFNSFSCTGSIISSTGSAFATNRSYVPIDPDSLPSYFKPMGLGGTWTCPYDGCNRKVWEAEKSNSISMIQDHFSAIHASSVEDVIGMESKPFMPVHRLMGRIKSTGSVRIPSETKHSFAPRIVRRY